MLRTIPTLETLQHEMRRRVCMHCHLRPRHSEGFGPEAVRSCEMTCPVFVHLPMLRKTTIQLDPMLGSRRTALEHKIDQLCGLGRSDEKTDPSIPLSQPHVDDEPLRSYRQNVVNTLLEVVGET
jgi:hypothetical protein